MANTESSTERWWWWWGGDNKDLHRLLNKWCGRGLKKRRTKQWGRKEGAGQTTELYTMQQGKTSQMRYRKDLLLILFLPAVVLIYYHPIMRHHNLASDRAQHCSSGVFSKNISGSKIHKYSNTQETQHQYMMFYFVEHLHKLTSTNVIIVTP